jgi:sec-independent protein translocase protein TatA
MFKGIGSTELIILALIVLVLFGGKKIPEFFKSLGESVKEFKKAENDKDEKKE